MDTRTTVLLAADGSARNLAIRGIKQDTHAIGTRKQHEDHRKGYLQMRAADAERWGPSYYCACTERRNGARNIM